MPSRHALALLVSGSLVCAVLAACSSNNTAPVGINNQAPPPPAQCTTPTAGCECSGEGNTVECAEKVETARGGLVCASGRRTCTGGRWGACDMGALGTKSAIENVFSSVSPMALGSSASCGDPCNPLCNSFSDTPTGLDAGAGFAVNEGGVQLAANPTCNTRITGQIFDPGDNVPLPNVFVFLQEGPLATLPQGVAQDSCTTILTGGAGGGVPDNRVQSGLDGSFNLQLPATITNGTPVSIVVQTGRWRKVITRTADCTTQNLGHVRLPRNQTEGSIPQFAIAVGDLDTLECFLAKVGVDTAEFTHPSRSGRVHMYRGCDGDGRCGPQLSSAAPHYGPVDEKRTSLLASQAELDRHSIVMFPCDGSQPSNSNYVSDAETQRVRAFTNAGGRIFATHLADMYLMHEADGVIPGIPQDMYPLTTLWKPDQLTNSGDVGTAQEAPVNTAAPRAQTFRDWLASPAVNGLNGNGRVSFSEPRRRALASVIPLGNTWLPNYNPNPITSPFFNYVHHITFDTPVGSLNPAGRVVYMASHVAPVALRRQAGTFPSECLLGPALTPSERALEYMLFDLSACVGAPPPAPAPLYTTATYNRDFVASCPTGTRVRWRQFQADVDTPGNSRIQFRAATADNVTALASATVYDVHLSQGFVPDTPAGGILIDGNTSATTVIPIRTSRSVLRISAEFTPTSDGQSSPTMFSWSQRYECEQAE